jgi:hypothetical protein
MGRKRHTAEQIIGKLRTAEIELAGGALVEAFTRAQPRRTERSEWVFVCAVCVQPIFGSKTA